MVHILLAAAALVVVLGAPATAQVRDPFIPLISEQTAGEPGAPSGDAGEPGAPALTEPDEPVPGGMPATGQNLETLLALAYVLLAAGAALLVVGRLSPPGARSRARRR